MSMTLMVDAMRAEVGSPLTKLVLLKLADNANDKGECWPSYQHIADQCEIGRSTVKSHIKKLADAGFLKIQTRNDGKSSNHYRLTIQNGQAIKRMKQTRTGGTRSDADPVSSEPGQLVGSTRSAPDPVTRSVPDPRTSHSSEPVKEPVTKSMSGKPEPLTVESDLPPEDPEKIQDREMAEWMFERVRMVSPFAKKPNWRSWADTLRLMRERDGIDRSIIARVFAWANQHDFWKTNILSPSALRRQFPKLHAKYQQHLQPNAGGAQPVNGHSARQAQKQQVRQRLRDIHDTNW